MPSINQLAYGLCPNPTDLWFMTNLFDSASTISGASSSSLLGVERLRDPRVGKKWRTPPAPADTILYMQWNTAVPIAVFGVFGLSPWNVPMKLDIYSAIQDPASVAPGDIYHAATWSPSRSSLTAQGLWLNLQARPGLATPLVGEIRLTMNPSSGTCDVGRVWAGDYQWTPSVGHANGSEQSLMDLSAIQRTLRSGAVLTDNAVVQRIHNVKYDAVPLAEWNNEVFTMDKTAGTHQQLLFVPNYKVFDTAKYAILGYQEGMNPIVSMTYDRYSKAYVMREAG